MTGDLYLLYKPITTDSQTSMSFKYSESGQNLDVWQFIHAVSWNTELIFLTL